MKPERSPPTRWSKLRIITAPCQQYLIPKFIHTIGRNYFPSVQALTRNTEHRVTGIVMSSCGLNNNAGCEEQCCLWETKRSMERSEGWLVGSWCMLGDNLARSHRLSRLGYFFQRIKCHQDFCVSMCMCMRVCVCVCVSMCVPNDLKPFLIWKCEAWQVLR